MPQRSLLLASNCADFDNGSLAMTTTKRIKAKAEPKPVKRRYQNKVVTQGDRARVTSMQKLDFITEFELLKKEESGLTQSAARATISDTQKTPSPTNSCSS